MAAAAVLEGFLNWPLGSASRSSPVGGCDGSGEHLISTLGSIERCANHGFSRDLVEIVVVPAFSTAFFQR